MGGLLWIITPPGSSICSDEGSGRTSIAVNIELLATPRLWKTFFVTIMGMPEMKGKYAGTWLSVLSMISNASSNSRPLSGLAECLQLSTPYREVYVSTQCFERKMCSSWSLDVAYWNTVFRLTVYHTALVFVMNWVPSQMLILWNSMTRLLTRWRSSSVCQCSWRCLSMLLNSGSAD